MALWPNRLLGSVPCATSIECMCGGGEGRGSMCVCVCA